MKKAEERTIKRGRRRFNQLVVLTNIGLFTVINILVVALLLQGQGHSYMHLRPGSVPIVRTFLWVNAVAAFASAVISPQILASFERMQQRLIRQNTELRSLHAIDTAISSELSLNAILDVAVRNASLAVDGEFGALWIFSDQSRIITVAQAFYGVPTNLHSFLREFVIDRGSESTRQADAPQRKRNLEASWRTDPTIAALGLRNSITIPIKHQDNVLGVLMVGNKDDSQSQSRFSGFTTEDEELLTALATTVGVAIRNARLYEETERRGMMLRALVARIGDAINASSDASLLMQVLAEEAAGILGCSRVAVYEFDDGQEQFLPLAARNDIAESLTPSDSFFRQPLHLEVLLPPEADTTGEDGYRYYLNLHDSLRLPPDTGLYLSRPGFLFVLRSRDHNCIGLLCMLDSSPRTPSKDTWAFAQALAAQASIALENAQLSERTHALLAQARALQDATNKIAGELDIDRVLKGVMDSARKVLDADGYTLWDKDPTTGDWAQRATHGLGFIGAKRKETDGKEDAQDPPESQILQFVMREKSPLVIPNTAHTPLASALNIAQKSGDSRNHVRALLALPMVYRGKATGVMVLYYRVPHTFIPPEVGLAQSFAHQAANALENARLFTEMRVLHAREKRIAETLQRSLLPRITPIVGEFEIAYRYQPGLEEAAIGGDFLDLFFISPRKLGVVIADVSGKGLQAAVQTAMIKYTLRAFAEEIPNNPGEVLYRVNNVLCGHGSNLQGFVTLFFGVLDVQSGNLVYANAGHELPFLSDPINQRVTSLPQADGIALGCMPNMGFQINSVTLERRQMVLMFTDGLSEARNESLEFLGVEGLRNLIHYSDDTAEEAVGAIYERVGEYASNVMRDDVAMLLLKRRNLEGEPSVLPVKV